MTFNIINIPKYVILLPIYLAFPVAMAADKLVVISVLFIHLLFIQNLRNVVFTDL